MIMFIISSIALLLQLLLIVKWIVPFFDNKKKRKLFMEIGDFHRLNYEKAIVYFMEKEPLSGGVESASNILDMYTSISDLYFSGCSLEELKEAYLELKIEFAKHLPDVKKSIRKESIDVLLD